MGQSQGSVWVRGGTVVNADRQEKADVLCVDGAIAAVGPDVAALVPAGAQVITLSCCTSLSWSRCRVSSQPSAPRPSRRSALATQPW